MKERDDLGTWRRFALALFGLFLMGQLDRGNAFAKVVGVFGIAVIVAACGLVELAMALWYRARRRSLVRRTNTAHG